ncbi:hypothetical protein [Nocardia nova]|uniref:hypothetical protein n=1 Tax=Nocardia nova TaxID=37330 RepID=UPI003411B1FE
MGQELSIDDARLRALMQEYESMASEARQVYDELRNDFATAGSFWGEDELGDSFAETFVPDSRTLLANVNRTLEALEEERKLLAGLMDGFEHVDRRGKTALADPDADSRHPWEPGQDPAAARAQPGPGESAAPSDTAPPATGQPRTGATAPDRPGSDRAPGARQSGANPDAAPRSPAPSPADGGSDPAGSGTSGTQAPAASATPPASGATARPDGKGEPSQRDSAAAASKKTEGARGADARSNTPWSGRPADRASQSGPGSPRRVSAPGSRGGRSNSHPAPKISRNPAAAKRGRQEGKRVAARHATAEEGHDLAEVLMRRHGLRAIGFDTPGIELDALREIAAALDDVLTAHPCLDLPEFALDDCGDQVTRLDWEWDPRDGEKIARVRRLTFDAATAADVETLSGKVSADAERGRISRGSGSRPLYSTIVRELGHALDVTGGLRARPLSQRTLISEYLTICGDERFDTPLGVVVADFRRWRGDLSEYGFPDGRFESGPALADAFTEVHMNAGEAGAPARALHRLLVDTAVRHSVKRFPEDAEQPPHG